MIANYGYEDGSGTYYISINTDKCALCKEKRCLSECPAEIFALELDDWEEETVAVKTNKRNYLRDSCMDCKSNPDRAQLLPCQAACSLEAILHSW